jgi:hypothetical protein
MAEVASDCAMLSRPDAERGVGSGVRIVDVAVWLATDGARALGAC